MTTKPARAILLALAIAGAFFLGFVVNERHMPPSGALEAVYDRIVAAKHSLAGDRERKVPDGRWRRVPGGAGLDSLSDDRDEAVEQLESLGYASGTQEAGGGPGGIAVLDTTRACPGTNLVVSGHAPEAFLMDLEGRPLHRWSLDYWTAFPGTDVPTDLEPAQFWRRARLLPGGDLLAIFEGNGLIKIDKDSNLLWAYDGRAHHDLDLDAEGRIWVLTRKIEFLPRIHPDKPVVEDFVTVLDPDGKPLREISVLKAVEDSDFAALMQGTPPAGDLFHTNSLQILDGSLADRIPAFRAGNLLISLHIPNVVAVLDPDAGKIVWAITGMWRHQHDPTLLENGHILVFDNQGNGGKSRVIEIDPVTQEVAWVYAGDPPEAFHTQLCGMSQRLPNGDTLITESEAGRAFEVTPAGETVWKWDSPFRAGKHDELVATLLEVVRLPPETPLDWLPRE